MRGSFSFLFIVPLYEHKNKKGQLFFSDNIQKLDHLKHIKLRGHITQSKKIFQLSYLAAILIGT